MNLFVRADATVEIGIGHLMRCIAIGQAWRDRGGRVIFISNCSSLSLRKRILDEGFELVPLQQIHPDSNDLSNVLGLLKRRRELSDTRGNDKVSETKYLSLNMKSVDWVVLDGYHFTRDYQSAIKEAGYKVLLIDDYNHLSSYNVDILLNQNFGAEQYDYRCEGSVRKLLGTRFALIRREFLEHRVVGKSVSKGDTKVLITMGGADFHNVTLQVIESIKKLGTTNFKVMVVVGPTNQNREGVRNALQNTPFRLATVQEKQMPRLMAWADLAITTGGSTCWELCFLGVPFLTVAVAENQRDLSEKLDEAEVSHALGWFEDLEIDRIGLEITAMARKKRLALMSKKGREMVDGRGAKRVLRDMIVGSLRLRRTLDQDCELLYIWANDPMVRRNSFSDGMIVWEEHRRWFSGKIRDPKSYMYIACGREGVPIGQIRFDVDGNLANISYSIEKRFRGMGLGKQVVSRGAKKFAREVRNAMVVQGKVKDNNAASCHIFKALGFARFVDERCRNEGSVIYQTTLDRLDRVNGNKNS